MVFIVIPYRSDNDKLKMQLKKKDDDLMNARAAIDRFTNAVSLSVNSIYFNFCLLEILIYIAI